MFRKVIVPVLLIAVFVLSACTKNLHGGGVVTLLSVEGGQPGTASMAISFTCNDAKNKLGGILAWNDQTNGVQFTARLPQTPVSAVFGVPTCAEAAALAQNAGISLNLALINTQGQQSGIAFVAVGEPGVAPDCGSKSLVTVAAEDASFGTYIAGGCLDRGKIVFQ